MKSLTLCLLSLLIPFSLASLVGAEVTPLSAPAALNLGDGREGGAYAPKAGVPLTYPLELMDAGAGTVALWVRLDDEPSAIQNAPLLSSGAPPETWFYLFINEGKLGVVFQRGARPFGGVGEFYVNTSVDVSDWEAGSWHHVAVAWAAAGPDESAFAIFVDGEERDGRYNLNLAAGTPIRTITVGTNAAQLSAVADAALLDDVRIWHLPLNGTQITEVMEGGTVEESALVLAAAFDGDAVATASAEVAPDLSDWAGLLARFQ